jgi:hypothetical protein
MGMEGVDGRRLSTARPTPISAARAGKVIGGLRQRYHHAVLDRRRDVNIAQGAPVAAISLVAIGVGWLLYGDVTDAPRCGFWGVLFGLFTTGFFIMVMRMLSKRR